MITYRRMTLEDVPQVHEIELKTFHTPWSYQSFVDPGALKLIMNQKAGIGWTTGAHTALPVLTTATGAQAKRFSGFIDNTDIANILKSLLK